jgi:hypothetical protein
LPFDLVEGQRATDPAAHTDRMIMA